MANQGATLAAQKLQASWAADAAETDAPEASTQAEPPAPAPLSAPAAEIPPAHVAGSTPGPTGPLPGPAPAAPPSPGQPPFAP